MFAEHSTHRGGGLDKAAFTNALLRLAGVSPTTARGGRVNLIGKLLFDAFDAGGWMQTRPLSPHTHHGLLTTRPLWLRTQTETVSWTRRS